MEFLKWPKIPRLNRDMIITEKIDGTNSQVFIKQVKLKDSVVEIFDKSSWRYFQVGMYDYVVVPGSRNRFLTLNKDNFGFAAWVNEHAEELLPLGPGRHYGEWWGKGIQRTYGLDHKKFSLFNVSVWGSDPLLPECCGVVPVLHEGPFDTYAVHKTLEELSINGSSAAPGFERPEGIVVFHTAASQTFKVTLEGDETYKGDRG